MSNLKELFGFCDKPECPCCNPQAIKVKDGPSLVQLLIDFITETDLEYIADYANTICLDYIARRFLQHMDPQELEKVLLTEFLRIRGVIP